MFGKEHESDEAHAVAPAYKGFISGVNTEKKVEVLQSQLTSLVGTMPSFDALGYSVSDLEQVSKTLAAKGDIGNVLV